ncbi:WD40-repeat-containing domain protein [Suillus spraguei]|nr:WD40-repeat-containing domain protein [Suillus spraguei]
MLRLFDIARNAYLSLMWEPPALPVQTTPGQLTPSRTIPGHTDIVRAVAFFKDGRRVVTGSTDRVLQIWDMQTGILVKGPFKGHKDGVLSVAVSLDDRRIISGGWDQNIMIWDVEKKYIPDPLVQHTVTVNSVCFSPDGKQFASGSDDETAILWDAVSFAILATLPHSGHVCSVAFSSDSLQLATGSRDSIIRVWHVKNSEVLLKFNAHRWSIQSVVWLPDDQKLISASWDGTIGQSCTGHTDSIVSLAVSSDGSFIATASDDKTVRLWSTETYQQIGQSLKHPAWLPQQYTSPSEVDTSSSEVDIISSEAAQTIQQVIHAQLENAPLRLIDTSTGWLCDRAAQINTFMRSMEYKESLSSMTCVSLQTEPIREAVAEFFSWAMLSHRWERHEPMLRDVHSKDVYSLEPVGSVPKLQTFCKVARGAGYRWAWGADNCCIDPSSNVELQQSVNSMFAWYYYSALTIVYLSDVPPSSLPGALSRSIWSTRGWTFQEFLAPLVVLFYQADWSLYLDDHSPNHKESPIIMHELEHSTGINADALVAFRPETRGAREKLHWASTRVTSLQEDIAYSLFGIFGVHLPVIYGEGRHFALGRLLQEIIAQSGDISTLDWVGKPSEFNSCLPAEIISYKAPPCTPPSLSEDDIQERVSMLQDTVTMESASKLYALLEKLSPPRFANRRLQLPCIAFHLIDVRRRPGQDGNGSFTYEVKADGLHDLLITTKDKLIQFSRSRSARQTFLLIRPWNRDDLELPDLGDIESSDSTDECDYWSEPGSPSESHTRESVNEGLKPGSPSETYMRDLRLIVRLGQPFGALLLAQQRGGEYKRVASDHNIIAQVKDVTSVDNMMDVRTLEIL